MLQHKYLIINYLQTIHFALEAQNSLPLIIDYQRFNFY